MKKKFFYLLRLISSEEGIAFYTVLILSLILLAIMAGLLYMVISGTQISGMQKRYKTALEAGIGGTEITLQLIKTRGNLNLSLTNFIITASNVGGVNCMTEKLNNSTDKWPSVCDTSLTINPSTQTTYDMKFELPGTTSTYVVYSKIVDTIEGNSGGDEGLQKGGVVSAGAGQGEVEVMSVPYLYTIEVLSQEKNNPSERARLSILYQY